jgi:hypothetical protein
MLVISIKNIKWCLGLANHKYIVRLSVSRKNDKCEVNTGKLLKVNIKTIYLRKDITPKMLAIDVSGPLDSIRTTQLMEQVQIERSHVKCGKDLFVAREPCAKGTNSETENVAGFALSLEEGFEVIIFDFFTSDSFLQGFGSVLVRAADIDDGDMVSVGDDNVRSYW